MQQELVNTVMVEEFRKGMGDFTAAMKAREDLLVLSAKRNTLLIRIGLAGLAIFIITLFFLVGSISRISTHMSDMSSDIKSMTNNFQQVSADVKLIRKDFSLVQKEIKSLNSSVAFMQLDATKITKSVTDINTNFSEVNGNLKTSRKILAQLDKTMHHMDIRLTELGQTVGVLSQGMAGVADNLSIMTRDINALAAPMRNLPYSTRRR